MPIYEFSCCACGEKFEAYCSLSPEGAEGVKCPRCGKDKLERLVSCFSAVTKQGSLTPANKRCRRAS
jgi:putative FmdB family regulatory protein